MNAEAIYNILIPLIQSVLGCLGPAAISVGIKYIMGSNWTPDISDAAYSIIKKMDKLMVKGTLSCFICAVGLGICWVIKQHIIHLIFISIFIWCYSGICLWIYGNNGIKIKPIILVV